jgi:two-component system chemotaxis response regulator CheB
METQPVPIVICTAATNPKEVVTTFRLMEAGAVACLEKPVSREHPDFEQLVTNLLQTIKLMSEVKGGSWPRVRSNPLPKPAARSIELKPAPARVALIGIGASTGGPPVLQTILSSLPKDFPAPILIVQHIARGFLPGLVEWLNQTSGLQVQIASHGTCPLSGHAYLAPDDSQLGVSQRSHSPDARRAGEACGPHLICSARWRKVRTQCAGRVAQRHGQGRRRGISNERLGRHHYCPGSRKLRRAWFGEAIEWVARRMCCPQHRFAFLVTLVSRGPTTRVN